MNYTIFRRISFSAYLMTSFLGPTPVQSPYRAKYKIQGKCQVCPTLNCCLKLNEALFYAILTHYQTTKFRPDQIESICRRQFDVTNMIVSAFDREENIVRKGEIACTSNFSFSHNVLKRFLSKTR